MLGRGLAARLYSYVVRYDSAFAPNPFYGYCTLATCKPTIRKSARIGDWIVGCGSDAKGVRRGGHLVYAMRVTEVASFQQYWNDPRLESKKPERRGRRKQSCGDNIYRQRPDGLGWAQLDSFHTLPDGSANIRHINRDTGVDRVLISDDYCYFGGEGPAIPPPFRNYGGRDICKKGIGQTVFDDPALIRDFAEWCRALGRGYQGAPWDWVAARG